MKANQLVFTVLSLLGAAVFQLRGQQNDTERKPETEIPFRAEPGDAESRDELGAGFDSGPSPAPKDYVEAVERYRKAAEQNDAQSQYNLGRCYIFGQGVAKDEAEAVKWYRKAADQNYARAQTALGYCYARGEGVTKDFREAVKWYRKAAEQNFAPAQNNLGLAYANGRGVAKNEVEAVKWYRKAADQNYAVAQLNLFGSYVYGRGVAKDYAQAVKWLRKAADQSNVQAETALGYCYATGQGVAKEHMEAAKWYRKAAEQNFAQAEFNLGNCYANGQGVAKDDVEAVTWYRKAAEQNFAQAQISLALSYALGQGVAKDYVESYKWTFLAAGQGDKDAKETLTILENNMSGKQIAEGQTMARNFKKRLAPSAEADTSSTGTPQTRPESSGTGFFITEDGYLITNEHVAGSEAQVRLVTREGLISAKVVKVDAANDLALLKAEGKFAALPVAANRTMKLGSTVATVGFPNIRLQGFAPEFARREIGSLSGAPDDARYFQISVPVQPGNSGGALVDARGNVVGVLSATLSMKAALATSGAFPQSVNYAVKSSFLLGFLESVPEIAAKLKEPNAKNMKFDEVVAKAKKASVLVLAY